MRHPLEEAFVEAFHDPETGRLDAARVADAYRVSLSALARGLKITQSALSKRPTAGAAQAGLRELEFVWATLLDLLHTDERVRGWLNTKRADLDGRAAIDLLTGGAADAYLRDLLLYRLTIEAQKRIEASPLSRREIVRRLGTSAAQLYRLLDQTNYGTSVDQLLALLQVLDCDVDFVVRAKTA